MRRDLIRIGNFGIEDEVDKLIVISWIESIPEKNNNWCMGIENDSIPGEASRVVRWNKQIYFLIEWNASRTEFILKVICLKEEQTR